MKKLKLLPTILMLVLCVGVLAIGIYAVTPTKNTISGSITINASNPEVLISAYTYTNGTISSTPYMQPTSARSGVTIPLPNNALTLDTSSANTKDDLAKLDTKIAIRIQNPSSDSLGAYFSTTPMTTDAGAGDVKKVVPLVNNVLQASLSGYTEIVGNNATTDMLMTFSVLDFVSSSTTVTLGDATDQFTDIYLNIETYNVLFFEPDFSDFTLIGEGKQTLTSADTNGVNGKVRIADTVTSINSSAFGSKSNITAIYIPDSVDTLIGNTFSYCSGLRAIWWPNSITTLDSGAIPLYWAGSLTQGEENDDGLLSNATINENSLRIFFESDEFPEYGVFDPSKGQGWDNIQDNDYVTFYRDEGLPELGASLKEFLEFCETFE